MCSTAVNQDNTDVAMGPAAVCAADFKTDMENKGSILTICYVRHI